MANKSKRVVVTGLGLICALGENTEQCWNAAANGVTGIAPVKSVNAEGCYANLGAEVAAPNEKLSGEDYDRSSLLCIKAAGEALADSGFEVTKENSSRIGVIIGNCVGGAVSIDKYYTANQNGGGKNTDVLKMPAAALANNVAYHFGLNGTTANIVNACAAGTISLVGAAGGRRIFFLYEQRNSNSFSVKPPGLAKAAPTQIRPLAGLVCFIWRDCFNEQRPAVWRGAAVY